MAAKKKEEGRGKGGRGGRGGKGGGRERGRGGGGERGEGGEGGGEGRGGVGRREDGTGATNVLTTHRKEQREAFLTATEQRSNVSRLAEAELWQPAAREVVERRKTRAPSSVVCAGSAALKGPPGCCTRDSVRASRE